MKIPALVTDAHLRNALAGIRGLGRAGISVSAGGPSLASAGLWSRYALNRHLIPDSATAQAEFVERIASIAKVRGDLVIYPCQEPGIDALLGGEAKLGRFGRLPYSNIQAVSKLRDKRMLAGLARDVGLSTPATLGEGFAGELRESSAIPVPCVVKPLRPGKQLSGTEIVRTTAELEALLGRLECDEPLLVQEPAFGLLMGIALVRDSGGRMLARFQQVAKRTWPSGAGNSTLAVGVRPDNRMARASHEILESIGYSGLAHLQFLVTEGGPQLIDVNTRFYGSLPLALASGVNLPAAWHAAATDAPFEPVLDYKVGITYRWLEGELLLAARDKDPRHLVRRVPRPRTHAVWSASDPAPGVLMSASIGIGIAGRRARGLARAITGR